MNDLKHFKNLAWCKQDWDLPELSPEAKTLLKQSADLPEAIPNYDLDDIIARSNMFPTPFPIDSVRLTELKKRKSLEILKKNINSTYPVMHERALRQMALFLIHKREHGSDIEKALYKDMTVPDLIDRILKKRAMCFMSRHDKYMLRDGTKGNEGWEAIGTPSQVPPLILDDYLNYCELKLSALVYISSHTICINDGGRRNCGELAETGVENNPVIIGVIGPRFQREYRMDCEDILITEKQNCAARGYGEMTGSEAMWRRLWADFYDVPNSTFPSISLQLETQTTKSQKLNKDERQYTDRYVSVNKLGAIFDNEAYHKRLSIVAETTFIEAEARAREAGRKAFVNIIGAGLGVWKVSPHQNDVFVLSHIETIRSLLKQGALNNVTDVNFAYIKTSRTLQAFFKSKPGGKVKTGFIQDEEHPNNGINIYLEDREPSSALTGPHAGKLLVMTYPWDGNAHPGNEFWMGKLASSGDPAAACSTQISELHNAYINPTVCSIYTRVATAGGLVSLKEYAKNLEI